MSFKKGLNEEISRHTIAKEFVSKGPILQQMIKKKKKVVLQAKE